MNCVKCGREIPEDQVFCEICLAEMDGYPVKPDTAIHIPSRAPEVEVKKSVFRRKRVPTAEEQVPRLKKKLRRTRWIAAVLLLVNGLLCFAAGRMVVELDWQRLVGQNYKITGIRPIGSKGSITFLPTVPTEAEPVDVPEVRIEETAAPEPEEVMPPAAAPTEPATEPPTEPATEAPTEVPTEVPTEAPTEPATEPPTEAATEPEATEEEREEPTVPMTEPVDEPAANGEEPEDEPADE